MHTFAKLLDQLFFTYSHLEKEKLLQHYIANTPDPDRGYALAIISGELSFSFFKSNVIKELMLERIDPYLFALSYDYVGDLSETVSLLWPAPPHLRNELPKLSEFIESMKKLNKDQTKTYLATLLDQATTKERWAILKLGTGALRIGVSARFIKQTLAKYGHKNIQDIEKIWHGLTAPYASLFAWLENKADLPDVSQEIYFHPVMLANPLNDEDLLKIDPELFALEYKFDGIRVQVVITQHDKALFSRSGDNISSSFPDILAHINTPVVLDGELVIRNGQQIGSFNDLQQRLNRRSPSAKLIESAPAHVILYDILSFDELDTKPLSYNERRKKLYQWFERYHPENMSLSEPIPYQANDSLRDIRDSIKEEHSLYIEGLMIKRKQSSYLAGRPVGQWYKWKRDPLLVDAVLMYAQRGSGKRSSYYSDFTFGLWQENILLPVGKAYSGFSDEELLRLDKWVRHHILQSFGPVREVEKNLVVEIAFDAVNLSTRHKSGVAMRFPRFRRIRWDKPANEADTLENLKKFIK